MDSNEILVLESQDASLIISKRSLLPTKVYLSVKGCITAMSEKLKIKDQELFLIELDHCVFIMVKDFHLYWHCQLKPQETTVFYNLRLTTVEKGLSTPQPVLVAWRESRILKAPKNESVLCSPLQEWLSWKHLNDSVQLQTETDCKTSPGSTPSLISYAGKVTSVKESDDGIYELDDNVRLITTLTTANVGVICLHNGCTVQIFNAHRLENDDNTVTLVCCCRTLVLSDIDPTIKVNMVAAKKSIRKHSTSCNLEDLKQTIAKYRLNWVEIERILKLRNCFQKKTRKEMAYLLHYLAKSFCGRLTKVDNRSVLDGFFHHKEHCSFEINKSSTCRIPTQLAISDLQHSIATDESNDTCKVDDTSNLKLKWNCWTREWNKEILIGMLHVNEDGKTEFVDESGSIPVVLIQHTVKHSVSSTCPGHSGEAETGFNHSTKELNKESDLFKHHCNISCQNNLTPVDIPPCPYLTPSILGKMMAVNKFHLVSELNNNDGCDYEKTCIHRLNYLIFSLQDCILLEAVSIVSPKTGIFSTRDVNNHFSKKTLTCNDCIMHSDEITSCFVYLSEKKPVIYSHLQSNTKEFNIKGRILHPSVVQSIINGSTNNSKENYDILSMSTPIKDLSRKDEGNNNNTTNIFNPTHAKKLQRTTDGLDTAVTPSNQPTVLASQLSFSLPVSMTMNSANLRHFPMLQDGVFYCMRSPKSCSSGATHTGATKCKLFEPLFSNEILGKVINKCGARSSIQVPERLELFALDRSLMETLVASFDGADKLAPISFTHLFHQRSQESLVSFTATVIHRETKPSWFSSQRHPQDCSSLSDIRLDLCNPYSSHTQCDVQNVNDLTISIYFNGSNADYILGLIPGAVVEFCCVERKVSRKENVYLRFVAVSSLHIKSFKPVHMNRLEHAPFGCNPDSINLPKSYIAMIWTHNAASFIRSKQRSWHIQCHICVVFSLKIELLCNKCNGKVVKHFCISRGCGNSSFDVVASCVVLVEDGTSQAIVKVRQFGLVKLLLTLNEKQWDDTISLLQHTGSVFISKQNRETSSDVEVFMTALINSSVVIRPCHMLVRMFKDSPCSNTVSSMKKEEFPVKELWHSRLSHQVPHLPMLCLDCLDFKEMG